MKRITTLRLLVVIILIGISNILTAQNNGPNAPEASGFEPVSATDMVNLSSGDMAYVLPLLEVDGFPVTLSYHAGIPMDMEASWVGLGWNINTGAIARGVVANPDDWGIGRRLNLTYLYGEIDSYSVNVGVGIGKAAEVGVGLSWGSNKSISGSVSASVGPLSASIDTNGNYSVGVSTSGVFKGAFDKIEGGKSEGSPFGGSLSISGNTKKGGISANLGVGGSSGPVSGSMGISISGNGVGTSYSIGGNNQTKGGKSRGGGAGISMNSFSAGDMSYNTKGFYIPINIGIFNFGFGFSKTKITLAKAHNKYGYGILYHNLNSLYDTNLGQDILPPNTSYDDYQRRNTYGDVYEQSLPQPEVEFIGDYRNQVEKLNFAFGGYDSYDINASGIGGALRPIVGQNTVLIGEGYDGESIRTTYDKTKVFYHNSTGNLKPLKSLSNSNTNPYKLNFSFDGQITENAIVSGTSINNYSGSSLNINNFINSGSTLSSRPKSGSYVEVYTNAQIDAGADIMIPASLKSNNATRASEGYIADGIGGYKITTPDGKIYHFAQPVYHYEQVQHNFLNFDATNVSKYNSSSKREATPYATHWLLTAITGPDFIDVNNNKFADEDDYGYWVRLDHGQWSNAYAWRSPYDTRDYTTDGTITNQSRRHYSTFIDNEIEKSDPGSFLQGRKDIYYIDKIVSKNQTAFFVKDIRHDAFGTSADYKFLPTQISSFGNWQISSQTFNDPIETQNTNAAENAKYDKEYLLRLDKIIIVNKKESEISISNTTGNGLGTTSDITKTNRYQIGGFFEDNLPNNTKSHKLHQSNNILDINDVLTFDYSNATKVIKFNHSYNLAGDTPSSGYQSETNTNNPNFGRLTLESVKTYGRGKISNATENDLYDYMPPYVFEYKNPTAKHEENQIVASPDPIPLFPGRVQYTLDRANKDNWGFRGDNVDSWSLNKITTPQGASIEVKYQEDDFYIESFGRRYWENNLQVRIEKNPNANNLLIKIQNHFRINQNIYTDFRDYFTQGEEVFIDLYICRNRHAHGHGSDRGRININSETYNLLSTFPKVISVTENDLILELNNIPSNADVIAGDDPDRVYNRWFAKHNGDGSNIYEGTQRECPTDVPAGGDHHKMTYKLLSNKVAPGTSGGGLRVKDIIVNDDAGNKTITRYDYNNPNTGKTSGITSFNPIRGEVFVPYQNELPGPGVMYEWVTMKAIEVGQNNIEKEISSIRYHYYTLQPVFDIFNPNIDMKDIDGESIFKTEVVEIPMNFANLTAKEMKIEKNLTKIGQLISTEEFNEYGHLMSKTTNSYESRVGELSETFSSMKSVFDFNEDDDGDEITSSYTLNQRYLSLSTKSEKVSVVKSIENIAGSFESTVTYEDPDEYLGTYTTSIKTLSDGTEVKEQKIPAYTKYAGMRSKLLNPDNKNMLTQEAMNVTSIKVGNTWKTLSASISTWNDNWTYRDYLGSEVTQNGIWRKHKSFAWKDAINTDGTYETLVDESNDYFNWGLGEPTNNNWQKASEITRYTHWSSPIESKDINDNFASSKMADNDSKVIAGANARYTEMYYSGAENPVDDTYFDGEVEGVQYVSDSVAHTGAKSLHIYSTAQKGFRVQGNVNTTNGTFRPGKYKVSFWAYNKWSKGPTSVKLKNNGTDIPVKYQESFRAGDWTQLNYYFELSNNTVADIYITSVSNPSPTTPNYYDDFRLQPIYASMNSYVYDDKTDELSYILDANNMATKFVYDNAGRLCKTYKEVATDGHFIGGFKLANQYRYNYQGLPNQDCDCCDDDATTNYSALNFESLEQVEIGSYMRTFKADISGGSGNYKYEWRWMTDFASGNLSEFVVGEVDQQVPFAPEFCDEFTYNKYWLVEAKVTDNTTGDFVTKKEEVYLKGCKFKISEEQWANIEISSNYEPCDESTKYTFRPYVISPEHTNYSYWYQDYNSVSNTWSADLPVTGGKNTFCPTYYLIPYGGCKSGFIKYYVINYKVIDNETGNLYLSNTLNVYLECMDGEINEALILENNEQHDKYAEFGNVLEKNNKGEIINIYNINNIKK